MIAAHIVCSTNASPKTQHTEMMRELWKIHFDDKNQTSFAKRVDPLVLMLLPPQHLGALFFDFGFRVSQRNSVLMFDGITNIDRHRYDSAIYACVSFLHFSDPILLFHSPFFLYLFESIACQCLIETKSWYRIWYWLAKLQQKRIHLRLIGPRHHYKKWCSILCMARSLSDQSISRFN